MPNPTLDKIRPYAKAVVGFVAPGAVLLGAAVTDASPGGSSITAAEMVTAVVACIITAAGVWRVPNTNEAGAGELKLIALVVLGVILAVVLVVPFLERTF